MEEKISRIKIAQKINHDTPICVIEKLVEFYQIKYDSYKFATDKKYQNNLLYFIETQPEISIKIPPENADLEKLAFFLNPDLTVVWTKKSILLGYSKIKPYFQKENYKSITPNFNFGNLTPENLDNLDLIIVYGACVFFNIALRKSFTPEQITNTLRDFLSCSRPKLKKIFLSNLDSFSNDELFNLIRTKNLTNSLKKTIDSKLLEKTYKDVAGKSFPYLEILEIPKTNEEAIVYAALKYKIDLSDHTDPIISFLKIIEIPPYRNLCRNLETKFNPKLPRCLYGEQTLRKLAMLEGYSAKDIKSGVAYELCVESYYSKNFFHGKKKNYTNSKTFIDLEDLKLLNYHECITYGTKFKKVVYTYRELFEIFNIYQYFFIPEKKGKGKSFNKRNINKLLRLCSSPKYPSEQKIDYDIRKGLYYKIKQIESTKNNISEANIKLFDFVKKSEQNKKIVEEAWNLLTEMTMYMRSWDGKGDYPIENTLTDNEEKVKVLVAESWSRLDIFLNQNKIEELFMDIPLVDYHDGDYINNVDSDKGLTLGERFKIINDYEVINSCIRTTSNWFLATISKNMIYLGLNPKFDINKVRKIG